ncbi:MAG: hypothetical protein AAF830_11030 [Pseudomonadota bacterium]
MGNSLLISGGCLGMMVAVIHGVIGEKKVVRGGTYDSEVIERVLRAIMALSGVYWFVAGALIASAPWLFTGPSKFGVVLGAAAMLATGSLGNLWATRGRHIGWVLLAIAVGLSCFGLALSPGSA